MRQAGGDPGSRVGVRDRAIAAATELIVADGVAALTVEAVTRRVGCAATSVYAAFGDREGLLAAVFERHAPLPVVEGCWPPTHSGSPIFESGVRAIYTAVFDTVADDTAVLQALFAEVLAKPNGIGMQFFRDRILPRITSTVGAWLKEQIRAGHCADLPLSLLIPLLIAPISVHLLARPGLVAAGAPVPDRAHRHRGHDGRVLFSAAAPLPPTSEHIMKSVVITGSSSGIGRACALRLDRKGLRVFAGVRKDADGDALRARRVASLTPVTST